MSNKTTLQNNNDRISSNNTNLNTILQMASSINNIQPSEDLSSEFNSYETALTTQETTIDDIMNALQGKAAGGGNLPVVVGTDANTSGETVVYANDNFVTSENTYTFVVYYDDGTVSDISIDFTFDPAQNMYQAIVEADNCIWVIIALPGMIMTDNLDACIILIMNQITTKNPSLYAIIKS